MNSACSRACLHMRQQRLPAPAPGATLPPCRHRASLPACSLHLPAPPACPSPAPWRSMELMQLFQGDLVAQDQWWVGWGGRLPGCMRVAFQLHS